MGDQRQAKSRSKAGPSRQSQAPVRTQQTALRGVGWSPEVLQQRLGNRGTQAWLAEQGASQQPQTKLTVGQPSDMYEQEAGRVAETVMRMPVPAMPKEGEAKDQATPLADRITPFVRPMPKEEAVPIVQQMSEPESEEDEEGVVAQRMSNTEPEEGDEEEKVQAKLVIQRQREEEEEELLHGKFAANQASTQLQDGTGKSTGTSAQKVRLNFLYPQEEEGEKETVQRQEQEVGEEEEELEGAQRKVGRPHPIIDVPTATNAMKGSAGGPLGPALQAQVQRSFGADFRNVRVHNDAAAGEAAQALNARAFTRGSDIYLGRGESPADRGLMGHELTHVIQQTGQEQHQRKTEDSEERPGGDLQATSTEQSAIQRQELPKESPSERQFPPDFVPESEARKLHEAFSGWGTDERLVFDILWTGRRDMTWAIEAAYNRMYRTSLDEALRDELSGDALRRALQLLKHGQLTLRDKLRESVEGWGTDEQKMFNALDRASKEELNELRNDWKLLDSIFSDLSGEDRSLFVAYLEGKGTLAGKLRRAVDGWGTDEKAIWRGIQQATEEEKDFVLRQPRLLNDLKSDLSASDWMRCERSLKGTLTNIDQIEIAAAGWGTEEAALKQALGGLTQEEFKQLLANSDIGGVEGLNKLLEAELSGSQFVEAQEILHQKRIAFDSEYREQYLKQQGEVLGEGALREEGASVLVPNRQKGESISAVGRLKVAAAGVGTDEKAIWHTLNSLTPAQRRFILQHNPEGVLDALQSDLSDRDYRRVLEILQGGAASAKAAMYQAVQEAMEGWGTDKRLLYDAVDRALKEGVGQEILADSRLDVKLRMYVSPDQYRLFRSVLAAGEFTPIQRLRWATVAMVGTDEDLVFELCRQYGKQWYTGSETDPSVDKTGAVQSEVNEILRSELDTRDYWKALDLMRGTPKTEEGRLARAKEMLERERGESASAAIMDALSFTGENADDAWREYRATYNRALEDGKVTKDEEEELRKDERYSQEMTADYREAKTAIAQWATNIAVAIIGVVATILTGGAAGPFVLALGGKVLFAAQAMVLTAAVKVGLNRAIQGQGYDLTSSQALVDAVSASVEVGLSIAGGHLATRFMEGLSKTALAGAVGPAVTKAFGKAGSRILAAGLEGSIDATIGGIGECIIQGLADEKTWAAGIEGTFKNMSRSVGVNAVMSGAGGFAGGVGFKSIGETIGPRLKGKVPNEPTLEVDSPAPKSVAEAPSQGASRASRVQQTSSLDSDDLTPQQLADELAEVQAHPELMVGTPPNRIRRVGKHVWREGPGGRWCRQSIEICVKLPGDRLRALKESKDRLDKATERAERVRSELEELRTRQATLKDDLSLWEAELAAARADVTAQEAQIAAMRQGVKTGDIAAAEGRLAELHRDVADYESIVADLRANLSKTTQSTESLAETLSKRRADVQELMKRHQSHTELAKKIDELEARLDRQLHEEFGGMYPPTKSEWYLETLRLRQMKRQLSEELYRSRGVTTAVSEWLRGRTPPKGSRRSEILDSLEDDFQPGGRWVDAYTGQPIPAGESVILDHVVPFKEIIQMDGFNKLTRQQQLEVLNLDDNLLPQSLSTSSSKLDRSLSEWFSGTPLGRTVPKNRRPDLLAREARARQAIREAIESRLVSGT